jgi:hypothetical protein
MWRYSGCCPVKLMCQAIVQRFAGVFTYAKEWHEVGTFTTSRAHAAWRLGRDAIRGSALPLWVERWSLVQRRESHEAADKHFIIHH